MPASLRVCRSPFEYWLTKIARNREGDDATNATFAVLE
jgi:hypothetical protein